MIKLAYSYAEIENPSDKDNFASVMQEDLEKHYGTGKATVETSGEEYIITIDGRGTYKIKQDGTVEKAGPTIVATLTGVKVVNSAGTEVTANSTDPSTSTLFINFGVTVDKGTITSVTDSNGTALTATEGVYSYEVSANGEYNFIVNATVEGENASDTTDAATVNQFDSRAGIQVGDYINYTPTGETYSISNLNTYSGSTYNGTDDLTLTNMGSLDWQVLRIYEDGRMDLIGSPTSKKIYFKGARGYNNGVYLMNDICKTVYSREGIEARSINIEDMEYWLTETGKTVKQNRINSSINQLSINTSYAKSKDAAKNTVTYKTEYSYYPDIYQYQKGAGINTTSVNTTGISESDEYYTVSTMISADGREKSFYKASSSGLTAEQTHYGIEINQQNYGNGYKALKSNVLNEYWLASRCVKCDSKYASFELYYVASSSFGSERMMSSDGTYGYFQKYLRPVVTLPATAQVTAVSGASTNANTPHQITKY